MLSHDQMRNMLFEKHEEQRLILDKQDNHPLKEALLLKERTSRQKGAFRFLRKVTDKRF